jgi:DNA-binding transcriptional ArsR family regulator
MDQFEFRRCGIETDIAVSACRSIADGKFERSIGEMDQEQSLTPLTTDLFQIILSNMVNYKRQLDETFSALSDPTRRAILAQLEKCTASTTSELAQPFKIKLPAVMKHLDVLDAAGLIERKKSGRTVTIRLRPQPMKAALEWLQNYERHWNNNLDRLTSYAEEKESQMRSSKS